MKFRKEAVRAFARANPIDRAIYNVPNARYGIITTGKAHLDVLEALATLGVDERRARAIGLDIYKVGIVWPLEMRRRSNASWRARKKCSSSRKSAASSRASSRSISTTARCRSRELILGKHDEAGAPLISWVDELSPSGLAPIIAQTPVAIFPESRISVKRFRASMCDEARRRGAGWREAPALFLLGLPAQHLDESAGRLQSARRHRLPFHGVVDGPRNLIADPDGRRRRQLGLEVAAPQRRFRRKPHIFQNLGDGTYYHSGSMAIRQAIAARANITYKILFNDAVAMTGGQPVDGVISVPMMAAQLAAEGVRKIVIV